MQVIVDTNVPVVANGGHPEASARCVRSCTQQLRMIARGHRRLVIDAGWQILSEYMSNLRSQGQPGVGDAFLKWVLTNRENPRRCIRVVISRVEQDEYAEFPTDPDLAGFDRSDRKFVAVAVAHPKHPPVLNATDSDWWHYRTALERHGVSVEFVCPDAPFMQT